MFNKLRLPHIKKETWTKIRRTAKNVLLFAGGLAIAGCAGNGGAEVLNAYETEKANRDSGVATQVFATLNANNTATIAVPDFALTHQASTPEPAQTQKPFCTSDGPVNFDPTKTTQENIIDAIVAAGYSPADCNDATTVRTLDPNGFGLADYTMDSILGTNVRFGCQDTGLCPAFEVLPQSAN